MKGETPICDSPAHGGEDTGAWFALNWRSWA